MKRPVLELSEAKASEKFIKCPRLSVVLGLIKIVDKRKDATGLHDAKGFLQDGPLVGDGTDFVERQVADGPSNEPDGKSSAAASPF